MNDTSAKLLDLLQNDFPLESRPFLSLSRELGITEDEVLNLVSTLKNKGYIRRLGGVFNSKKLGYKGTLCAMKVPEEQIREVSEMVNAFTEITHNYLRTHEFNMWFTITASSSHRIREIIKEIKKETGIEKIVQLNSLKSFKLKVQFDVGGKSHAQ